MPSTGGGSGGDERTGNEADAPAPVQDVNQTEHGRGEPFLEDESTQPQAKEAGDGALSTPPSPWSRELAIVGHIALFSILGTLARLGVQWLTFYPGAPITTPVLWANVGGSFFMGFLSEDKKLFQRANFVPKATASKADHEFDVPKPNKKVIPLYTGLATGFCGSFTSFSTFMRDAFLALANELPSPLYHPLGGGPAPSFSSTIARNDGWSVLSVLAVLIIQPALSMASLFVGAHAALALQDYIPSISHRTSRRVFDPSAIFLGFGSWLAVVFVSAFPGNVAWRSEALFALVFAPLGAYLRYFVSLKMNPMVKSFPLGTFTVNMFGSVVLAMTYDLQRVAIGGVVGGSIAGCQVLQGIEDGFCGCLTTVSTWVSEIQGLRRRHAYFYALSSVLAGLALMVLIMGGVRWSIGWSVPICVTMRTNS